MKKQYPQEEGIYLIQYFAGIMEFILIDGEEIYNFLSNERISDLDGLNVEFCSQKLEIGYSLDV